MSVFKITTIHINALVAILLLTAIAITVLVVEAANQVVGCALGEVMLMFASAVSSGAPRRLQRRAARATETLSRCYNPAATLSGGKEG